MANPTIRVHINNKATPALNRLITTMRDSLKEELSTGADEMLTKLRAYPAMRPNQKYVRTNRLHDSWRKRANTITNNPSFTVYSMESVAPYNRYVQVRATQSKWHRGRWTTIEDVRERDSRKVEDRIRSRLRKAMSEL
jgi:hypothetical protein